MTTFVLVHGAYHGGWCWRAVSERLTAAGHRALAPTLTGLGERAHLLTGSVDLETHIADVLAVLEYEDVTDGVLVGHSYGGFLAAAVADRAAARLAHVVLLDSPVPVDGEAAVDVHPRGREMLANAVERGGIRVMPVPTTERLGIDDPAQAEWVATHMTPQPFACQVQPMRLTGAWAALPRTYIRCTRNPSPRPYLDRVDQDWTTIGLDTGHDAMVSAPDALTDLLLTRVPEVTRA